MVTIFWTSKRMLVIEYLSKTQTINATYFATVLDNVKIAITEAKLIKTVAAADQSHCSEETR